MVNILHSWYKAIFQISLFADYLLFYASPHQTIIIFIHSWPIFLYSFVLFLPILSYHLIEYLFPQIKYYILWKMAINYDMILDRNSHNNVLIESETIHSVWKKKINNVVVSLNFCYGTFTLHFNSKMASVAFYYRWEVIKWSPFRTWNAIRTINWFLGFSDFESDMNH